MWVGTNPKGQWSTPLLHTPIGVLETGESTGGLSTIVVSNANLASIDLATIKNFAIENTETTPLITIYLPSTIGWDGKDVALLQSNNTLINKVFQRVELFQN